MIPAKSDKRSSIESAKKQKNSKKFSFSDDEIHIVSDAIRA